MGRFDRQPRRHAHAAVVRLSGALDISTAHEVEAELHAAEGRAAEQVIVDLSGATFVDCRVIALLEDAARRAAAAGRDLDLVGAVGCARRVLELLAPHLIAADEQPEHLQLVA